LPMHRPGSGTSPAFFTRRARLCGATTCSCHPPGKVTFLCFSKTKKWSRGLPCWTTGELQTSHAAAPSPCSTHRRATRPSPPLLHHRRRAARSRPLPAAPTRSRIYVAGHDRCRSPAKEELRRRDRRRRGRSRAPLQAYRDRRQSRGERGLSRIEVKKRLGLGTSCAMAVPVCVVGAPVGLTGVLGSGCDHGQAPAAAEVDHGRLPSLHSTMSTTVIQDGPPARSRSRPRARRAERRPVARGGGRRRCRRRARCGWHFAGAWAAVMLQWHG
jgi:hypothetical protein